MIGADRLRLPDHIAVPVLRSRSGQPHATGLLNGRSVSVLLDTGAAHTVVSLRLAETAGLAIAQMAARIGGAGAAAFDAYLVEGAELVLGGIRLRTALLATDLDRINLARERTREWRIDIIAGVDVFAAHDAVIDFGRDVLYLRA
jgi:predicted aspartyl protease